MNAKELRQKETAELIELENQLKDELFRLRMKHYSGQLQNVSELRNKRRDIARVKTILAQKRAN